MSVRSRQRRDVDDVTTATLFHKRNRFVTAVEDAAQVRFDNGAKIVGTHRFDGSEHSDAGIVHQDINAAECLDRLCEVSSNLCFVADVTKEAGCASSAAFVQLRGRALDLVFMTRAKRNVQSGRYQRLRDGASDSLCPTGNDGSLPREIHCSLAL